MKFTRKCFKNFKNNRKFINAVKKGFDVYKEIDYEKTFYQRAIQWGSHELVQACIDAEANPDCFNLERGARSSPITASSSLITAMRALSPDNMKVLLKNGADVNEANEYGVCQLLLAAEEIRPHPKFWELVKIILRNSSDINAKNTNGKSALYLASLTCDKPVIKTLINGGAKKSCLSRPRTIPKATTHIDFFSPVECTRRI